VPKRWQNGIQSMADMAPTRRLTTWNIYETFLVYIGEGVLVGGEGRVAASQQECAGDKCAVARARRRHLADDQVAVGYADVGAVDEADVVSEKGVTKMQRGKERGSVL
jgi:hypothetical protein